MEEIDTDQFEGELFSKELANGDPVTLATENGIIYLGTGFESTSRVIYKIKQIINGYDIHLEISEHKQQKIRQSEEVHIFQGPAAVLRKKYDKIEDNE